MLSDKQVNQIYDLLVSRGISYEYLRDELLDHLCCLVEHRMENGAQFHVALNEAEEEFGPMGIKRTQEATLYLLTLKLLKMKRITSILGVLGGLITIMGTVFKIMHWPGAGVLLVIGIATIALLFMPAALIISLKTKKGWQEKAQSVSGFVGGCFLVLFSMFKIMHWPGAMALFILGVFIMIFIFTPFVFIRNYRNTDNKWFDFGSLTVVLSGALLIFTLTNFHGYQSQYLKSIERLEKAAIFEYEQLSGEVTHKTQELTSNPALAQRVIDLQACTQLLVGSFYDYRNGLLSSELNHGRSTFYTNIESAINFESLKTYNNWSGFKAALVQFDKNQSLGKIRAIAPLLEAYVALSHEMVASGKSNMSIESLGVALEGIPDEGQFSHPFNMLYISYLNVVEHELKEYQHQLVTSVNR